MVPAACHVHSDWSYDGSWSLPALAAEFARRGYRVLMVTEHDRGFTESRRSEHRAACAQVSSDSILVIPGIEYSDAANTVHVLVWGAVPFLGEGVPTTALLEAVKAAGGVAVLAHPSRRDAWQVFDPAWTKTLLGIELWNRKTDGWAPSHRAAALLDTVRILPFAGIDFHDRRQFFPLTMALELPGFVTEESVLDCLRAGRCSARAFGLPVSGGLLRGTRFILSFAEFNRRLLARAFRGLARRRPVAQAAEPAVSPSASRRGIEP